MYGSPLLVPQQKKLGRPSNSLVPRGNKYGWFFVARNKQLFLRKNAAKMKYTISTGRMWEGLAFVVG